MVPDIENEVFSTVANALRAKFAGIFVAGEAVAAPSTFPAVTLVEDDNSTLTQTLDSSGEENHASVMYTANAYSNLSSGKKAQCKAILAVIDDEMFGMGFIRVGSSHMEMPNANQTIYRMVSRYKATVSKNKIIYRR